MDDSVVVVEGMNARLEISEAGFHGIDYSTPKFVRSSHGHVRLEAAILVVEHDVVIGVSAYEGCTATLGVLSMTTALARPPLSSTSRPSLSNLCLPQTSTSLVASIGFGLGRLAVDHDPAGERAPLGRHRPAGSVSTTAEVDARSFVMMRMIIFALLRRRQLCPRQAVGGVDSGPSSTAGALVS